MLEETVDLIGIVSMVRAEPSPRAAIILPDGDEVEFPINGSEEELFTSALRRRDTTRVQVRARGRFTGSGKFRSIESVDRVVLVPNPSSAAIQKPIWERLAELTRDIPQEELDRLPRDLASQHDHYIYGVPRRPE
ncbi:MAG TPA: hypothetical protein VFJ58_13190 [Armatimonadota bacterium]|nr:hypothetical protein [Armatimonadota bacterium]